MRKIVIFLMVLITAMVSIQAELVPSGEELQRCITGASWEWDGSSGESICFQDDGYIGHPGWSARGLATSWQVVDEKTVLLKVEKGRSRDLYAILIFSDDFASFSGFNFHGGARLQVSREIDRGLMNGQQNTTNPTAVLPETGKSYLTVEKEIDELEKQIVVGQSTPYLEVHSVKVHRDLTKTRCCIVIKFLSRDFSGATLDLSLLDEKGGVLGHVRHFEEIGPEEPIIVPGHNLDLISEKWNASRAIWLDFPFEARNATSFRIVVSSR